MGEIDRVHAVFKTVLSAKGPDRVNRDARQRGHRSPEDQLELSNTETEPEEVDADPGKHTGDGLDLSI